MNLRNEADIALDEALKEYLKHLMLAMLKDDDSQALATSLGKLNAAYFAANKVLDKL